MDFSGERKKPLFVSRKNEKSSLTSVNDIDLRKRLASLYTYLSKHLGIQAVPKVVFKKDKKNADNPLGLTGFYDSQTKSITIYTIDRHDNDILRSFAHEVIHHWQNERGTLTQQGGNGHYAQEDPNLRKREMEAYLFGNILFRDWTDAQRYGPPKDYPSLPSPFD